jgi:xanthine dehydrogenase accessory factor
VGDKVEDIHYILDAVERVECKKVLATVIRVEGSAYKKEGSSMLFLEDGTQIGILSAGCLEEDLSYMAKEIFNHGQPSTVEYNLADETDLSWGHGTGCHGVITVLLEPVWSRFAQDLIRVKELLVLGVPVVVMKRFTPELNFLDYAFLPKIGEGFGTWKVENQFSSLFQPFPLHQKSGVKKMDDSPTPVYFHLYAPRPRLIVFGAGTDARPLVSLSTKMGFSVTVCDWRTDFCRKEHFPEADDLIVGFPDELIAKITFTEHDSIIIMSHQFQKDRDILTSLLNENIRYLGVLGPHERTSRLVSGNLPSWVHSPVGIPIGAMGPEEIAVSIVAELIQEIRKPFAKRRGEVWTSLP